MWLIQPHRHMFDEDDYQMNLIASIVVQSYDGSSQGNGCYPRSPGMLIFAWVKQESQWITDATDGQNCKFKRRFLTVFVPSVPAALQT